MGVLTIYIEKKVRLVLCLLYIKQILITFFCFKFSIFKLFNDKQNDDFQQQIALHARDL